MDYKLLIKVHKLAKAEWEGYDYETVIDVTSKTDDPRIKVMAGIYFLFSWNWILFQDKLGNNESVKNGIKNK